MLSLKMFSEILWLGASLVVQWLILLTPNAGSPGSIPGQRTRSHMLQLKVFILQLKFHMWQQRLKISCAQIKTWRNQINVKKKEKILVYHVPLSLHTSQLPTGKAHELFLCWYLQLLMLLVWADPMYLWLTCFGELWPGLIKYLCFFNLIVFNTRNILYWGIAD